MRRRVVLFDLRGCGRSSAAPALEAYSREAAADDILAVAGARAPVHLLGFSFGGRLALRAAELAPERIRSLILASAAVRSVIDWNPEPPERRRRRENLPTPRQILSRPDADGAAQTRELALATLPLDVYDLNNLRRIRPIIERIRFSGQWGKAWRAGLLDAPPRDDAPWLRRAELPTLILHGQHDFRFPAEHTAELSALPHIRRVVLPEAGHLAHLEQPEAWAAAIERFVADIEAGRAPARCSRDGHLQR